MKQLTSVLILALTLLIGCTTEKKPRVPQVDFAGLEPLLNASGDTVYVVNFWATWCKPCVEELPAFEALNREYGGRNLRMILVSLDFPNKYEDQLLPFVEAHDIQAEVIHLTEVNANRWIDRVDPSWSGAIPATLVYRRADREFFEHKLDYSALKEIIEKKLN